MTYSPAILRLLGIDHTRLTFRFQGLDFRLTGVNEHHPVQSPWLSFELLKITVHSDLVFSHIPKTGGMTLYGLLSRCSKKSFFGISGSDAF